MDFQGLAHKLPPSSMKLAYRAKNKYWRNKFSHMIKTGEAPLPYKIVIEATLRCNLSCPFCFRNTSNFDQLTFEKMKALINNLGPSIKRFGFTGGEVSLRQDFFDILDMLQKKDVTVGVLTNATLFNETRVEKLVKYKKLNVGISMDGLEKTHNSIRGPRAFERTLKTIKMINKRINIGVNTVITQETIDEIIPLLEKISPYIHYYSLEFEMFNNNREIESSARHLGISADKITNWTIDRKGYPYPKEKIKKIIQKAKKIATSKGIRFRLEPIVAEPYLDEFYDGKILKEQPICGHIFTARSNPRGNLVMCALVTHELGNLCETPLPKLWNSEKFKDIRRRLLRKYMPPLCMRCCKLG